MTSPIYYYRDRDQKFAQFLDNSEAVIKDRRVFLLRYSMEEI